MYHSLKLKLKKAKLKRKLPEDRLPEELREFFIEIETPADILDESINNELTDNLLAAAIGFLFSVTREQENGGRNSRDQEKN